MDKSLANAADSLTEDEIFRLVTKNYHEANRDYLQKQIQIASEYLTDEQKRDLRSKGYLAYY